MPTKLVPRMGKFGKGPGRQYWWNSDGSVRGPYPAPVGYNWEYVTDNGYIVTDNGSRVVDLVRRA